MIVPCQIGRTDYTLSNVYVRFLRKTVWLSHLIIVPLPTNFKTDNIFDLLTNNKQKNKQMKKFFTLLTLLVAMVTSAWADATIIYSMTDVTGPTASLASGGTADVTATFVGGTAQVYNGKASAVSNMGSVQINLGGSQYSYFHATLTGSETIAEGDIITLSAAGTMCISATSEKPSSDVTFPYTVPSGSDLIGKKDVYLWKSGVTKFSSFTISRPAADDVSNPSISQSGNKVTITCSTDGANIYYTTDGSAPTESSTSYSAAFTIDDPCTVRAIAIKGEKSSSIIVKDCFVEHAAQVVLGYAGGTVSGDVWTSKDGEYTLTDNVEGRGINAATLAASNDAFKLNHVDTYTLKVSNDIKVTKIVVVGKTWLAGGAATIAFDGFTPASGSFYDFGTETYVKTIEFTPESELDFGATITITPGGNQLGAYIEIYGTERAAITPAYAKTTYVTKTAIDFSAVSPAGLKAYVATAAAGGKVTLEEVDAVPAGTPLMLIGTAGTEYVVPAVASASAPAKNMFVAADGTTEFDGTSYDYILASDGLFHQISSGKVAVGKAYLHCDSDPTGATAPYLTIDFGGTTGIKSVDSGQVTVDSSEVYNLAGQRIAQPTKGLYIVNGKKVILK